MLPPTWFDRAAKGSTVGIAVIGMGKMIASRAAVDMAQAKMKRELAKMKADMEQARAEEGERIETAPEPEPDGPRVPRGGVPGVQEGF